MLPCFRINTTRTTQFLLSTPSYSVTTTTSTLDQFSLSFGLNMKLLFRLSLLSSPKALLKASTIRSRAEKPCQSLTTRLPFSRLPDELLALILEFAQDDLVLLDSDSRFDEWLRNALVCRAWRQVILNSPTLWCCIRILSYRQAAIMFEWSRTAVIDVMHPTALREHYANPTQIRAMLSRLISDNLYRIRTLRLYGQMVDQFLSDTHPSSVVHHLTTLSLDTRKMQQEWSDMGTFFSGAYHLRSLKLCSVFILPSSSVFTANLTDLTLDGSRVVVSGAYTIDETVGVLKRTPFLRTLVLRYWIIDLDRGDADETAHLPELQTLTFSGRSLFQYALFADRLSLPQSSAVELECSCDTLSEAVESLSSFPRLPGDTTEPRYFQDCTLFCDISEIFIRASPYIISPGQYFRLSSGSLTLMISIRYWTQNLDTKSLVELLALLDLRAVFHLYLSLGVKAFLAWSPILSFFDALSDLHLWACAWHIFVRDLSTAVPYEPIGEANATPRLHGAQDLRLLCPHLQNMQLYHPLGAALPTIDPLSFESLAIVLELRRASGAEVQVRLQGKWFSVAELRNPKVLKRSAVWKYVKQ